jgi:Domain of unknown function (DUF5911)
MTNQLIEGAHATRPPVGGNPFPPIADYGFLSDCEVPALVAPSGNVEWMCLPRMDGPNVFAAMLALSEAGSPAPGWTTSAEQPARHRDRNPVNPIFSLDNVIITPHAAYYSEEAIAVRDFAASEVVRVLTGNTPLSPVNAVPAVTGPA